MHRFHFADILKSTGGRLEGSVVQTGFSRVQTDSRTIEAGDIFWALQGPHHDGHHFIPQAFTAGAVAAVIKEGAECSGEHARIVVHDTIKALNDFAAAHRRQSEALVVGVTGSVGKTTTREMIHAVLSVRHTGIRSNRNFNNHIGLPLTLLQLQSEHEFAVVEMGASRPGEIADLSASALPEVGVVTAVGAAHFAGFGSIEQIVETKGDLVAALPREGFAVLAGDDPRVLSMSRRARCNVVLAGEQSHNHIRATGVQLTNGGVGFSVDGAQYEVSVVGRHHLTAAVLAVGVAREVGMTSAEIAEGLRRFTPAAGRCNVRTHGPVTVIDDTYNSNPQSARAACRTLRDWDACGQRLLVAGDMLDLGEESAVWHRRFGLEAGRLEIDRLLAFGPHAGHVVRGALDAGMPHGKIAQCADIDAVYAVLDCWIEQGDVVLVKGSRGMRMERVVKWIDSHQPQPRMAETTEDSFAQIARETRRACA